MKTVFYFFLSFFIFSCGGHEVLDYAHNERYLLDKNETSLPITKTIVKENEYINSGLDISLPINKYVKSKEYNLFLNIALENNMNELISAFEKDSTSIVFFKKQQNPFNVLFQKKDSFFIYRTLYLEKEYNIPIVMTYYSKDSIEIKKLYDKNSAIKKIRR